MTAVLFHQVGWDEDMHVVRLLLAWHHTARIVVSVLHLLLMLIGWLRHLVWLVHGRTRWPIRRLVLLELLLSGCNDLLIWIEDAWLLPLCTERHQGWW